LNWWEVQIKLISVVGLESEELFDRPAGSCRRLSLHHGLLTVDVLEMAAGPKSLKSLRASLS
jgi:hypothetical protein